MTSQMWNDVLRLLTVIILADDRVYKEEVDTLVAATTELNRQVSPEIFVTDSMVFDWFVANRDGVKAMLMGPNKQREVDEVLVRLRRVTKKNELIKAMVKIARADSQYHDTEDEIIRRAAKVWGLSLPAVKPAS